MKIISSEILKSVKEKGMSKILPGKLRITVSAGTCGIGNGALEVFKAFETALKKKGVEAYLCEVGCFGFCAREPLVGFANAGQPLVFLENIIPEDVEGIVSGILPLKKILGKAEAWDHITEKVYFGLGMPEILNWDSVPFFKGQKKIVLRNCGLINPEDIEEYIGVGGYSALDKTLNTLSPEQIIE